MTINRALTYWLNERAAMNPYITTDEFESARTWISDRYGKRHLVSTIERSFRYLKTAGVVKVHNAKRPGDRQSRWLIRRIDMSKLR